MIQSNVGCDHSVCASHPPNYSSPTRASERNARNAFIREYGVLNAPLASNSITSCLGLSSLGGNCSSVSFDLVCLQLQRVGGEIKMIRTVHMNGE
jgi:hypothetical protein